MRHVFALAPILLAACAVGGPPPCTSTERTPAPREAFGGGITVGDVVTAANGDHPGSLQYTDGRCSGLVVHIESANPVLIHWEGQGACPGDELRIPATMTFRSADGAFDETAATTIWAEGKYPPSFFTISIDASMLTGTFAVPNAGPGYLASVFIEADLKGDALTGFVTSATQQTGSDAQPQTVIDAQFSAPGTCP